MKIALLLTGNELMSGDTVDSNSAFVAQAIKEYGLVPTVKMVVGDDLALLVDAIESLSKQSDFLLINGGLGPTRDDLTAVALAQAANLPLTRHQGAMDHLTAWASQRDFVLTDSNLKQADLPEGAQIIDNPRGSAVGFYCEVNDCVVACTPGVPSELKLMVSESVIPMLTKLANIEMANKVTRLRLFGITESGLQDIINESFPDWPSAVDLGFRVQMPVIEVKLTTQGAEHSELNDQWTEKFIAKFGDYIIGRDDTRLAEALNKALLERQLIISTAESCTGGAIAAGLTSEPGSSSVFEGGFVVYSNQMKHSVLGVAEKTLQEHGAVSQAVVEEMVQGALFASGADVAVAISGIAGPTGGTPDKPVGTVWMAWGRAANADQPAEVQARRFFLPIGRFAFQRTATAMAMDLVRRYVLGLDTAVDYFSELKRKQAKR